MAIQELDEDEPTNDSGNLNLERSKFTQINTFDLTASRFPDVNQIENPSQFDIPIEAEDKKFPSKNGGLPIQRQDSDPIGGSFEDLEDEARALKKQEEAAETQVKLLIKEENRIIFDDYIQNGQAQGSNANKHEIKNGGANVAPVDWFKMYSSKDFDFRNSPIKLQKIRISVAKDRVITPTAQVYDALRQDPKNPKDAAQFLVQTSKKNHINQALEEALMCSQVILGNNKNEASLMKQ